MNTIVKKALAYLTQIDFFWYFLKPFSKVGYFLFKSRSLNNQSRNIKEIESLIFKDLTVQNGPFRGLKYPKILSIGSSIYPKLLGCYEKELWGVMKYISCQEYTDIIDIGCAEGYYAVGLGINIPNAKVHAYDINNDALILCREMARLNNIDDRIITKSLCTEAELGSFNFTGKGLIICDCEGYEKELFTTDNVSNLISCDLVIETHDFLDRSISSYLESIFSKTHDIKIIKSLWDAEKTATYEIKQIENLNINEKHNLLSEGRPTVMKWLFIKSIDSSIKK